MLAALGAQTGWSDQVALSGTVRSVGGDGSARDRLANLITARTVTAPNKRELVLLEGFTDKPTLHTILIGTDLYTEVSGIGWEKGTDAGFALTQGFIHDSFFGAVTLTALKSGLVSREADVRCADESCYVLSLEYIEGAGSVAVKVKPTIQVHQKSLLPTRITATYTYGDGVGYQVDTVLRQWGAQESVVAPKTIVAPSPSPSPTPAPTPPAPTAPISAPTARPTPAPTPAPTPVPIDPLAAPTGYSTFAVSIPAGTVTVKLIKERLADVTIRTVTGNSVECTNDCPAKRLEQYVIENNAFAGMNGSYFCPPDYADCAGRTYTYDYAVYNSVLRKWLNPVVGLNGLATFNGKTPTFYRRVNDYRRTPVTAGIANYPMLMLGGTVLDFQGELSPPQNNRGGVRGAIGVNATHVFLVIAYPAAVTDLAYVMQALGARDALNLDGGGSATMWYGGDYVKAQGRLLPNAIVLTRP
jgi:hypothetical protein